MGRRIETTWVEFVAFDVKHDRYLGPRGLRAGLWATRRYSE